MDALTPHRKHRVRAACAALVLATTCLTHAVSAQTPSNLASGQVDVVPETDEQSALGFSQGSFIAVPIPFNEPTFGAGLLLGGGYLFQMDEESETSFLGLGGFRTNNGSNGYGLGGSLSMQNARWNASFFLGEVDLFYDLSVLGEAVGLRQTGQAAQAEFRYGFTPEISAGLTLRYLGTSIASDGGTGVPPEIDDESDLELGTVGLVASWDRLDSSFYPTSGTLVELDVSRTEFLKGAGSPYDKAVLNLVGFTPLGERGVVGGKAVLCSAGSEAPFYDSCTLGGTDGFRGYPVLQFYGDRLTSVQGEYRGRFSERVGYVAFAGAAEVSGSLLASTDGTKYAGGLGLRYRVSKDFGLDLSLDASINDDGDDLVYLYVGQAF